MGVHGLWKLIEPSGKPVPLETLENKVLAIDISIWLHQAIKGFQDSKGAPLPNAHLLGIYHRVCKLLYFRIKPVFVFDGGIPVLKKETIAKRNQLKSRNLKDANSIQKQLLSSLLKHSAVSKVLSEKAKASIESLPTKLKTIRNDEDLFKLPPQLSTSQSSSDEETEEDSSTSDSSPSKYWNIHEIDEKSSTFKSLPADVRHEILTDLKETRKQSSWGRLHELPTESNDFATFQMKRLLKRFSIQSSLEDVQKEMGGKSLSLHELETLLNDHGVITDDNTGNRIASDENTRFIYMKNIKKTLDNERIANLDAIKEGDELKNETVIENEANNLSEIVKNKIEKEESQIKEDSFRVQKEDLTNDLEYQQDLEKAIQLSLQDGASTSKASHQYDIKNDSILESIRDYDFESSDDDVPITKSTFSAAKSYMLEYSGLTPSGIDEIMGTNSNKRSKSNNKKNMQLPVISEISEISRDNKESKVNLKKLIVHNKTDDISSANTIHKTTSLSSKNVMELENNKEEIFTSKGVEEVAFISSSESSDEDDFVDVNSDSENKLEIIINPKSSSNDDDEDIFADVFQENSSIESTIKINLQENIEFNDLLSNKLAIEKLKDDKILENLVKLDKKLILDQPQDEEIPVLVEKVTKSDKTQIGINIQEEIEINTLNSINVEEEIKNNLQEEIRINTQKAISEMVESIERTDKESNKITTEDLIQIEQNLQRETDDLISSRATKERLAGNITDQIYQETKDLLHLFGIPYIVAPMEAEAQCAFLNEINLTDGTITDDSDIWLFGGQVVYKNFFNHNKQVMEYRAENIQRHFNLSRNQLILLALLVGSDYTTGIQGIGPVTALEVLASFPPTTKDVVTLSYEQLVSGLIEFRNWCNNGKTAGPGRTSLRSKIKNVDVSNSFPSLSVIKAYLEPSVETSRDNFTWGSPDVPALMYFAKEKFGWTQKKSEEILKPVLKRLNEKRVQSTIRDYFKTKHKIEAANIEDKMSKRVKNAVNRMNKHADSEDDEDIEISKSTVKKSRKKVKKIENSVKNELEIKEGSNKDAVSEDDEEIEILKSTVKKSRRKVKQIEDSVKNEIEIKKRKPNVLHKKEVIPQKTQEKSVLLRNKLKAIEVFRKSQKGPGYVKKRAKVTRTPKNDAELSESSNSD